MDPVPSMRGLPSYLLLCVRLKLPFIISTPLSRHRDPMPRDRALSTIRVEDVAAHAPRWASPVLCVENVAGDAINESGAGERLVARKEFPEHEADVLAPDVHEHQGRISVVASGVVPQLAGDVELRHERNGLGAVTVEHHALSSHSKRSPP